MLVFSKLTNLVNFNVLVRSYPGLEGLTVYFMINREKCKAIHSKCPFIWKEEEKFRNNSTVQDNIAILEVLTKGVSSKIMKSDPELLFNIFKVTYLKIMMY